PATLRRRTELPQQLEHPYDHTSGDEKGALALPPAFPTRSASHPPEHCLALSESEWTPRSIPALPQRVLRIPHTHSHALQSSRLHRPEARRPARREWFLRQDAAFFSLNSRSFCSAS